MLYSVVTIHLLNFLPQPLFPVHLPLKLRMPFLQYHSFYPFLSLQIYYQGLAERRSRYRHIEDY